MALGSDGREKSLDLTGLGFFASAWASTRATNSSGDVLQQDCLFRQEDGFLNSAETNLLLQLGNFVCILVEEWIFGQILHLLLAHGWSGVNKPAKDQRIKFQQSKVTLEEV